MEILESQIIPNLLKANESASPFFSTDGARTELPTQEEIARFAQLCMDADQDAPDLFVQALMVEGLASEAIFLHLLAPTARYLGELWDDDLCDFTQVTIGLVRMQLQEQPGAPQAVKTLPLQMVKYGWRSRIKSLYLPKKPRMRE